MNRALKIVPLCAIIFLLSGAAGVFSLSRPDKEFKIFQFPRDQIPRIDGDTSDWNMVPAITRTAPTY